MDLEPHWYLEPKSCHFSEWHTYVWHDKSVIQMAMDHVQHPIYIGSPYTMAKELQYAVFRYDVADITLISTYECTQDLAENISVYCFYLYQFQSIILHICVLWAICRYNNVYGCGNMEHYDRQTWRPSLSSSSIFAMSAYVITSYN